MPICPRPSWQIVVGLAWLLLVPLAAQRGRPSTEAIFENGRYSQGGVTFDVPTAWKYEGTGGGDGPADTTAHWIADPQTSANFFVFLREWTAAPADLAGLLENAVSNKASQRARQGYRRWRLRPESVQHITVSGHEAVVAVADFEIGPKAQPKPRVEYLTWVFTPARRVQFSLFTSPDTFSTLRPQFDRIVQSARVP